MINQFQYIYNEIRMHPRVWSMNSFSNPSYISRLLRATVYLLILIMVSLYVKVNSQVVLVKTSSPLREINIILLFMMNCKGAIKKQRECSKKSFRNFYHRMCQTQNEISRLSYERLMALIVSNRSIGSANWIDLMEIDETCHTWWIYIISKFSKIYVLDFMISQKINLSFNITK